MTSSDFVKEARQRMAAEKARNMRYRRPMLASLGWETIESELNDMEEACGTVHYFIDDDEDSLIAALDGDEDEAYEFRIYNNITVWNRNRDPYSLRILYRDNFTCQKCGEFHAFKNEYGVYIPTDDGELNVHHIVPVSMGGGDEPENLVTVCVKCHKHIHSDKKEDEA